MLELYFIRTRTDLSLSFFNYKESSSSKKLSDLFNLKQATKADINCYRGISDPKNSLFSSFLNLVALEFRIVGACGYLIKPG